MEMFQGWHLIGQFPKGYEDGVGSWILSGNKSEFALLELPYGMKVKDVEMECNGEIPKYIIVSHYHEDHYDRKLAKKLFNRYYGTNPHPYFWYKLGEDKLCLNDEPLYVINVPKHSWSDIVVIYRGVAMTGDIELGTLDSVNDEVPIDLKRKSMKWLAGFEERNNYKIHTVVSAHLNDIRRNVDWKSLFTVEG